MTRATKQDDKWSLTDKQAEVWRSTVPRQHRWNVSLGATRSGKTYLDYYRIPYRIRNADKSGHIVLLGNTQGTIRRNVLDPMRGIWGGLVGDVRADNKVRLFGRDAYVLGADKVNQVARLQGSSIAYCYGDEVTTWSEEVFQMLKSRLDRPMSCFDGTCNPAGPKHWFKAFLDDPKADIYQMPFEIDDNPTLVPQFVADLKHEYAGTVYYDRYILGRWTAAEGIIYRRFADHPEDYIIDEPPDDIVLCTAGMDFGGSGSAHTINLTGITRGFGQVVTLDEYYSKAALTPTELEQETCDFLARNIAAGYRVTDLYCDSAEQTLIKGVRTAVARRRIPVVVHNARKGPINDRINLYCRLIGLDRYKIMRRCEHTIEAFSGALWDSKRPDERLDDYSTNIDSLDAQEYSTEPYASILIER